MRTCKAFDCDIALRDLFSSPTLVEFATLISISHQDDAYKNLVGIRLTGKEPPLYFVHAGGGGVGYASEIAPTINAAIPIYGLYATGLTVGEQPLTTVPQMAQQYVKCIRRTQPYGPYRLAGWSSGGTIAYEMAKIFLEEGDNIEFLGLIDTFHVSADHSPIREVFDEKAELLEFLSPKIGHVEFKQIKTLADLLDFSQLVNQIYALGLTPKEMDSLHTFDAEVVRAMLITLHATTTAVRKHWQTKLSIPVWHFEAQDNQLPSSTAWKNIIGNQLRIVPVPGNHHRLLSDDSNRRVLGAAISEILLNLQSNDRYK